MTKIRSLPNPIFKLTKDGGAIVLSPTHNNGYRKYYLDDHRDIHSLSPNIRKEKFVSFPVFRMGRYYSDIHILFEDLIENENYFDLDVRSDI